ncbi:hypothetical protein GCM10020221_31190 [Streptomyces thioluteus]|uniref:Integral membrane protein n=1 Tax=Streptomyces thioluteus TaxID=66431 RepID=A0ABP6JH73_STRTU
MPYCLGGRTPVPGQPAGWALLFGGAAATAALVLWAGVPRAMVGVPGARISNLNPPTLAAVTFGLAQCGAALLLPRPACAACCAGPPSGRRWPCSTSPPMTVFLWHQTAMMAVTALGSLAGRPPLPGLHTLPTGRDWVLARLAWLPCSRRRCAGVPVRLPHPRIATSRRCTGGTTCLG